MASVHDKDDDPSSSSHRTTEEVRIGQPFTTQARNANGNNDSPSSNNHSELSNAEAQSPAAMNEDAGDIQAPAKTETSVVGDDQHSASLHSNNETSTTSTTLQHGTMDDDPPVSLVGDESQGAPLVEATDADASSKTSEQSAALRGAVTLTESSSTATTSRSEQTKAASDGVEEDATTTSIHEASLDKNRDTDQTTPKPITQQQVTETTADSTASLKAQQGHDTKESERHSPRTVPRLPGAVAVSWNKLQPDATTTVLPTATVLSQPEPSHVDDSDEKQTKEEERQTRNSAAAQSATGAVVAGNADEEETSGRRGEPSTDCERPFAAATQHEQEAPQDTADVTLASNPTSLVSATPIDAMMVAEAIQVTIDEEQGAVQSNTSRKRENGLDAAQNAKLSRLWNDKTSRMRLFLFTLLLVIGIALAITLPLYRENDSFDDPDDPAASDPSPTFDYSCYPSTLTLIMDQLGDINQLKDTYVLCPNTTIEVGTLVFPEDGLPYFSDGDYPIWVFRPGITVQCGLDGRSENNCIVDGGFIQAIAMPTILLPPELSDQALLDQVAETPVLDNVTLRGITFTGEIQRAGPSFGTSVAVSQSGTFTLEDCHWKDMTNQGSTISVYRNDFAVLPFDPMPVGSVDVRIVDSSFRNIVFGSPLLAVTSQNFTTESCLFESLTPTQFSTPTCDLIFGPNDAVRTEGGCVGLLYCGDASICNVINSCLSSSEITGPSFVYFIHNTSDGVMMNNHVDVDSVNGPYDCEWARGLERVYERKEDAIGNYECAKAFKANRCSLL